MPERGIYAERLLPNLDLRRQDGSPREGDLLSYSSLAPLNAVLNSIAAVLLLAGFVLIKRGHVRAHRACMISAFAVSAVFLASYLAYHYHVGDVRFTGRGWVRPAYFTMLISHIALAGAIVPLAIITLTRALRGRFVAHRRIALWTWPIWIYVSVTGVLVYVMVYQIYGPPLLPPSAASQTIETGHR